MQTSNFTPSGAIDAAVRGLGYDLVSVDRSPGGLMRVTIDFPWPADGGADVDRFIGVEDCERVSRQLQHVLQVEGQPYERLEVSSPGLDRALRHASDFERFEGELVEVTLKASLQGRKHWRGELRRAGDGWRVVVPPPAPPAKGRRTAAERKPAKAVAMAKAEPAAAETARSLDFSLAELREARLVPTIDFKGRRRPASAGDAAGAARKEEVTEGARR